MSEIYAIAFDPGKSTGVAYQRVENGPVFTTTIKWENRFEKLEELLEKLGDSGFKMFVEEYKIFNASAANSHIDQVLWGPEMISLLRYLAFKKKVEIVWIRAAIKAYFPMETVRKTLEISDQPNRTEHARDAIKLLAAGLSNQGVVKPQNVKE